MPPCPNPTLSTRTPRPYARPAPQPPPTLPALQGLLRPGWAFPLGLRTEGRSFRHLLGTQHAPVPHQVLGG